MYKCGKCNKNSKPGEAVNKVVTQTRSVTYENTRKVEKSRPITKRSTGWEIVKEVNFCKPCYSKGINNEN